MKKETGGESVSEPILIPGEPLIPEEATLPSNRPEPQVPGNKLNPEDPNSNCGITELLTHLYNEANKNQD